MVPLGVLDDLKIEIPSGLSGNLDLLFDLIDDDGVVLSERTVEVRVTPAVTPPPLPLSGEVLETAVARSAPGAASGKEVAAAGGPEPEAVQHNDAAIARSASPPGGAASGEAVAAAPGGPEPKAAQRYATVASGALSAIGPAATLVKRGQDFIANGDLAAARLVLRRAVDRGDAQAALLLGSTYDPASFKRLKVIGLAPDPGQARAWYQRAVDLGSAEAVRRLEPLAQGAR
jgi:TPR repeat protein